MTNAERIRGMSDGEMTRWLSRLYRHYCPGCPAFTIDGCPVFEDAVDRAELEAGDSGQAVTVEPDESGCMERLGKWLAHKSV